MHENPFFHLKKNVNKKYPTKPTKTIIFGKNSFLQRKKKKEQEIGNPYAVDKSLTFARQLVWNQLYEDICTVFDCFFTINLFSKYQYKLFNENLESNFHFMPSTSK